jgi:glycosyltransferase involved in cell wall biosynthesis
MYAEEFYRFSWRFMKRAKIVATFHMPPELLAMEVFKGNQRGRVGQITHYMNKKRFARIDAAIVTSENQKDVLKNVIDEKKIHLIPLGVHLKPLLEVYNKKHQKHSQSETPNIVTVGNWLRDWEFYFSVVAACPEINFTLINRNLSNEYKARLKEYRNIEYKHDVTDNELFETILHSDLQFLPLQAMAGSNALLQSLALGCPTLIPDYEVGHYKNQADFIKVYQPKDIENCILAIQSILNTPSEIKDNISELAVAYAQQFDWSEIADQHLSIFADLFDGNSR